MALAEQLFGLIDMADYLSDRLAQIGIVEAETAGESIAAELSRRWIDLLFRYVGPVRASWLPAAFAAAATAFLMVVGAQAISWYLTTFGGSSLSGAFGALLLILSWVYYEAQILLGGVQLVKVLTRRGLRSESGDASSVD